MGYSKEEMKPEHEFTVRMAEQYLFKNKSFPLGQRSYDTEGKLILELLEVIEELGNNENCN